MYPDAMGRPKDRFKDLPPHMTAREGADGTLLYYFQANGKKKPLGTDKAEALRQWAILKAGKVSSNFTEVADAYQVHITPLLARSSAKHYRGALDNLRQAFGKGALEQIEPKHVKQYIRRRTRKGAAIFEKKVLSAMWNWAREEGITSAPNAVHGIKFSQAERKALGKLGKRDVYVTDEQLAEALQKAQGDPVMQDCLELGYRTAQRPGDLLKMTKHDYRGGQLLVVQEKTGTKVPIRVHGRLQTALERALARPRAIQTIYIVADEKGQRLTYMQFHKRFRKLGLPWQFRDLRAKGLTDLPDLKHAQRLAGHSTETTTTIYRRSTGAPIDPVDREI